MRQSQQATEFRDPFDRGVGPTLAITFVQTAKNAVPKIIVNTDGFDVKNLRLANYPDGVNPIEDDSLQGFELIKMDITKMTREALKEYQMRTKEKDRAKNMFVLGFLYWMYDRDMKNTEKFLEEKFSKKPDILESNLKAWAILHSVHNTPVANRFAQFWSADPWKDPRAAHR